MRCRLRPMRLLPSLAILGLAGCSTPTIATGGVSEAAKVAKSIGHVSPHVDDTCETQIQLAQQSSRIDTLIEGREKVYKPHPCGKPKAPAKVEPKTS